MTHVDLSPESTAAGGSTSLGGYLAEPSGTGPFPAVLMIHEAFGLNDMTAAARGPAGPRRLSDAGGGSVQRRRHPPLPGQHHAEHVKGSGRPFTDLATARNWLANSPLSNGKTGVIGFCMGGGFALLVARDGFDAASVNYGRLPSNLEEALRGACPIVANFGGRDTTLKGAAGKLETALTDLGIENSVKEFPTAGHAFLNDAEPGPRGRSGP